MIRIRTMIGMALLGVTVAVVPTVRTHAADADLAAKVQSAKTAADHEALATDYDARATAATQNAAMHRRMSESYKAIARAAGRAGEMPQHCETLAKGFDAEAEQYKAMAQTHRDIAKTM